MNITEIGDRLSLRLDALRDGTPETDCLIDTIWDVLERYVFINAYIAANRDSRDFADLLSELVESEENWPADVDPDVLALFDALREEEERYRLEREVSEEA
ncbi:MAG: hypothetical protein K6T65_01550 [Peptococcaceae bacterium]|nr:hypothetical protein [Peptococcaceae bacterium]